MTTPYQMLVQHDRRFPSVVGYLKSLGHAATAVHPYGPRMYRRDVVYPVLGFDRFVYDDLMHDQSTLEKNDLISDSAAFGEAERQLDRTGKPLFLQLTTMQNHYPMAGKYAAPVPVSGVGGSTVDEAGGTRAAWSTATRPCRGSWTTWPAPTRRPRWSSTATTPGLLEHRPRAGRQPVHPARDAVLPLEQLPRARRRRPRGDQPDLLPAPAAAGPRGRAAAVLPAAAGAAGRAARDGAGDVRPTATAGSTRDPEGLDARGRRLLHDYRLVQYDLSVGHRYSQAGLFYPQQ